MLERDKRQEIEGTWKVDIGLHVNALIHTMDRRCWIFVYELNTNFLNESCMTFLCHTITIPAFNVNISVG